jgi:hypothetical protein
VVEIGLELVEFRGEPVFKPRRQIAGGDAAQRPGDRFDRLALALFGCEPSAFGFLPFLFE